MKEKLYPPRFKAVVQAKNKDFFESSKYLHFQLICGSKIVKGKLLMPGRGTKTMRTYNFNYILYYRYV